MDKLLRKFRDQWEATQMAIAFAQAGEYETAKKIIENSEVKEFAQLVNKKRKRVCVRV
jgi:hypothetical protein